MRFFDSGSPDPNKTEDGKDSHDDFKPKNKSPVDEEKLNNQITEWIKNNDVVLFMKGSKKSPRCGFSNYVVQVLKFYKIGDWKDINILQDENLREQIKKYSNWPTIPQLYIKGQFIGGCDIVKEMHSDGSLEELLIRENIIKK